MSNFDQTILDIIMKKLLLSLLVLFCLSDTYGQIGIKTPSSPPIPSAQLEVQSTTKAFYPPRMNTAQKNAIAGVAAGAMVFDTDLGGLFTYNGSSWVAGSGLTLPYSVTQNNSTGNLLSITNSSTTNTSPTIYGKTNSQSSDASAIYGINTNTQNNDSYGVYGEHTGNYGSGVYGKSANGIGGNFYSNTGTAGKFYSPFGTGIKVDGGPIAGNFNSFSGTAVKGESVFGIGGSFTCSGIGGSYALLTDVGNVGIGTLTPTAKMEIKGSTYFSQFYSGFNEDTYIRGGKAGSKVSINDIAGMGSVGIGTTPNLNADEKVDINGRLRIRSGTSTAGVWFNNVANSIAGNDGAFHGMKLDTETGIFIGGTWRFWVNNVGNATLTGTLTQSSDRRLKKDFSLLNNSLSDIYQLKGYHYKWIEASRSQDLQTGLIAQEVQKIFPELVQTDEKGFLSVNYIGLIPHLIEAAKELKNENASLKSRLDKIEALLTNSQLSANNVINK
jgi:hypothetical protein